MGKSGMFRECEKRGDWRIRIVSLDFVLSIKCEGVLEIRRPGFCGLCDGEKNSLRHLRSSPSDLLRPQDASDTRPVLWGYAHLPGSGDPAGALPKLRHGETEEALLVGRQSVLYQALWLFRGSTLPGFDHPRCGQGVKTGLEGRQGAGQAIHAGAVAQGGDARAEDHRN